MSEKITLPVIRRRLIAKIIESDDSEGNWVTINGTHILIKDGETPEQALSRTIGQRSFHQKAHDTYGSTDDYKKAGWITHDGKMVDFSTSGKIFRSQGIEPDSVLTGYGSNHIDHSEIGTVTGNYGDSVRDFQQKGAMRFANYSKDSQDVAVSIDISGDYTNAQWDKVKTAVRDQKANWFAYDIYNGDKMLASDGIDNPSEKDIDNMRLKYNQMKRYFKK